MADAPSFSSEKNQAIHSLSLLSFFYSSVNSMRCVVSKSTFSLDLPAQAGFILYN